MKIKHFKIFAITFLFLPFWPIGAKAQTNPCECDFYNLLANQVTINIKLDSTQTEMIYNSIYNFEYQDYKKFISGNTGGSASISTEALGISSKSAVSEKVFNEKKKEYLKIHSSFQTGRKISSEEITTSFPNIGSDYNKCLEICNKQSESGITYNIREAGEKTIIIELIKNGEGECKISEFTLSSKSNIVNYKGTISQYTGISLNRNQPKQIQFERKANEPVLLSLNLTNCDPVYIKIPKKNMDTTLYWDFSYPLKRIVQYESLSVLTENDLHVIAEPKGAVTIEDRNVTPEGGITYISCLIDIPNGYSMAKFETEFARLEAYAAGGAEGERCSARVDISYYWGDQRNNYAQPENPNLIHRYSMDNTHADCPKILEPTTFDDYIPSGTKQITMVIKLIDNHASREFILSLNGARVTFSN